MAPFHTPWSTFLAWIVAAATVVVAVVRAIVQGRGKTDRPGTGD